MAVIYFLPLGFEPGISAYYVRGFEPRAAEDEGWKAKTNPLSYAIPREFGQKTLTESGNITVVRLTSCFTGLDLTAQVQLLFIHHEPSS